MQLPVTRAAMTSPSELSDLLMAMAWQGIEPDHDVHDVSMMLHEHCRTSLARSPDTPDLARRSEPARSTSAAGNVKTQDFLLVASVT